MKTVLMHPRPSPGLGNYIGLLANSLRAEGLEVVFFSPASVLRNRHAAVHIHWPEHLISHENRTLRAVKTARTLEALVILTILRRPVVWTAHNAKPHSISLRGWQRIVFWWMRRLTTGVIVTSGEHVPLLRDLYPDLVAKEFFVIPLASHVVREVVEQRSKEPNQTPCLLQFGSIEPYKQQHRVLESLAPLLRSGRARLRFVGRVGDEDYAVRLRLLAAELPGVEIIDRYLSDADLSREIVDADVTVALQSNALNSGVIPTSVPLGTPVVSANTAQARQYLSMVGDNWIRCVDQLPNEEEWLKIMMWASTDHSVPPSDAFAWGPSVAQHLRVYGFVTTEPVNVSTR